MSRRDDIGANARWGAANEPRIHYTMGPGRDDWLFGPPRPIPMTTDCSGFATACHKWAGAADPNGFGYRELGWTGSMLLHNPQIPVSACKIGDFIVYGFGGGDHVVIVIEPGSDPLVVSHGQEAGPIIMRHSAQVRYRGRNANPRALDTGVLDTPPTPVPLPPPEELDVNTLHYARLEESPIVYLVSTTSQPRAIQFFADADYWARDIEGNKITEKGATPPPAPGQPDKGLMGPDGATPPQSRRGITIAKTDTRARELFGFTAKNGFPA